MDTSHAFISCDSKCAESVIRCFISTQAPLIHSAIDFSTTLCIFIGLFWIFRALFSCPVQIWCSAQSKYERGWRFLSLLLSYISRGRRGRLRRCAGKHTRLVCHPIGVTRLIRRAENLSVLTLGPPSYSLVYHNHSFRSSVAERRRR